MRVPVVGLGECPLVVGLEPVVELHLGALDQLVDHPLHIGAGGELPEDADHPLHGFQVGAQCLIGAGVLDLDGDHTAVRPHRLVHLPDAGRGHRLVVERHEPITPLGAQLRVQNPVHLLRGQRRGVLLQLGQCLAVGLAELLGDGGFHHRERLAELHRAALELTEHGEQLVGRLLHQFGADLVFRRTRQSLAEPQCGAAGHPDGKARELRIARHTAALDLCHDTIIHDEG